MKVRTVTYTGWDRLGRTHASFFALRETEEGRARTKLLDRK
jgi:hypothetical protein